MTNGNTNGHDRNGTGNGLIHVNGNGHKPDAAIVSEHDILWGGLAPAVTNALRQPLAPALVSQRRGRAGRTYSYIEGHTAIDEANRVFGFGGWGYELAADVTLRRVETVDTKTGEVKVSLAYSAPVRVTVPGAPPRTDIGFHAVTERQRRRPRDRREGGPSPMASRGAQEFWGQVWEWAVRRPASGQQLAPTGARVRTDQRRRQACPGPG